MPVSLTEIHHEQILTHRSPRRKADIAVTDCHFVRMTAQAHIEQVIVAETTTSERWSTSNTVGSDEYKKQNKVS